MSLSLSLSLSLQRNGMDQISSHRITDFIDKFVVVFRAAWWWLGVVGHNEACISSTWLVACCRSRYVMRQLACKHCLQMLENCLWFLDTFSNCKVHFTCSLLCQMNRINFISTCSSPHTVNVHKQKLKINTKWIETATKEDVGLHWFADSIASWLLFDGWDPIRTQADFW